MTTSVFLVPGFPLDGFPLTIPSVLAAVKIQGSFTPVNVALTIALVLGWGFAFGLSWWRSPSKIRRCLRNKGMGLPELRDELRLGAGTFLLALAISLLVTVALAFFFHSTLYQQSYMIASWWAPLTGSWLASDTLFSEYRPMPWGVLLGVFIGWILGQMVGIWMGRRKGAAGILLTSRLHKPLKA
jgi:hypothetical protein